VRCNLVVLVESSENETLAGFGLWSGVLSIPLEQIQRIGPTQTDIVEGILNHTRFTPLKTTLQAKVVLKKDVPEVNV